MAITLTERQALICERALEFVQMGQWPQFRKDISDFSGEPLSENEVEKLEDALRTGE